MFKFFFIASALLTSSFSFASVDVCTAKIGKSQNLDKYDLAALVELGMQVVVRASSTSLDVFDLKDLAGRKNSKVTLCIDSNKFDRYDLKKISELGAEIVVFTSASKFDVYDYEFFASDKTNITIVVNDDTLDVFDLKRLGLKKSIKFVIFN